MNELILIGNPNVGKTTLYNTLTGSSEKASNWHGVTVDSKSKSFNYLGQEFLVTDLPGLYSLDGFSFEEKIASNYLEKNKDKLIINICDANNLERNLKLAMKLKEQSYNIILAVNMINDFNNFDEELLSRILNIKVIGIDARKKKSTQKLKNAIYDYYNAKNSQNLLNYAKKPINTKLLEDFLTNLKSNLKSNYSKKIDKIIFNKFLFLPVFFAIIFSMFYLTFGAVGESITDAFNFILSSFFDGISHFIFSTNMSEVLKNFLANGILRSISSVLSFLPQITILMVLLGLLEDTGLLSRFAFMLDGFMRKIGLTGKSLFSIMMGYGCTASAVLTTRNLENIRLRKRTALVLPFSTCSAKLPVFLVISSIFFEKYKYLFIFGLYLFSIVVMVICSCIYKKALPDKKDIFILEMPKYRLPYFKKIFKDTLNIVCEFIIKIGTTILIFSVLFWVLQNFSLKFEFLNGENFSDSILYKISSYISILFKPIGLNNAGIISVLIFGLVAKELVVVGLLFVCNAASIEALKIALTATTSICYFNNLTAMIFLIFILLYSPCISALSTIKNEFGRKTAWFVFISQLLITYLVCLIIYQSFINLITLLILFLISIAIVVCFMIKYHWKKACGGNCYACRKF